jgi:Zn-dependent protease
MLRDPLTWSLPLGRLFGINIRIHILFPIVVLGLVLRYAMKKEAIPGQWIDVSAVLGLLFLSVLLHELGHCFGGRYVDGEASDVLLWPLGGLAYVDVPQTPRAHLITAISGPAVNLLLCLFCALVLILGFQYWPPLHPFVWPVRGPYPSEVDGKTVTGTLLYLWGKSGYDPTPAALPLFVARLFWVNWVLSLFNLVLVGFPMDMGRIFQSILWRYVGYRQATLAAVFAGFLTMFVVGLYSIIAEEVLALFLAYFIYVSCKHEWIVLEAGSEEGPFGYDFSQGYTSLERDQATATPPPRRKLNWWQRWKQGRQARRMQREQEQRVAEERRMDELLDKVQRHGITALTDEERRFLERVSNRYKNRQ